MELDIIFENHGVIVINKPCGMLVHPDIKKNETLLEGVRSYLYKKKEYDHQNLFSPSLCGRLDVNTSGVVVIAKNHPTLKKITGDFRTRDVGKKYLALVYGKIFNRQLITSIIDASENKQNKVTVEKLKTTTMIPDKMSFIKNYYNVSATLINPLKSQNNCTLLEINLWTGKKHQIRAHLSAVGHPLLGDRKYYDSQSFSYSQLYQIKNCLLHSYKLKIPDYDEWTAKIPVNFKELVKKLLNYDLGECQR